MKTRKMNLDRTPLTSEYVQSKQNFDHVYKNYTKSVKPSVWKNPFFYGAVGLASIALVVTLMYTDSSGSQHDKDKQLAANEFPEDTKCIHAPVENVNTEFQTYEVDPQKDQNIRLESGTLIELPKGALQPIEMGRKVEIQIREFPSGSSSFMAGIPMDYQKDKAFESNGMIEIRGWQDGKEVAVNEEKPFKVTMALNGNPEGFDFWYLNESKKEWEHYPCAYNTPSFNKNAKEDQKASVEQEKEMVAKINNQLADNNAEQKNLQEPLRREYLLPIDGKQRFDIYFEVKDFPEFEKLKGIEFEVDSKVPYDRSFTKKVWNNMDLTKKEGVYWVTFSTSKEKVQLPVRPVLKGESKEKAEKKFETAYETFTTQKVKLAEEQKVLSEQKSKHEQKIKDLEKSIKNNLMMQAFQTGVYEPSKAYLLAENVPGYSAGFKSVSWGVFNCDKPVTYPKPITKEAILVYKNYAPVEVVSIFVFDKDKNVRFGFGQYSTHAITEFGVFEKHDNTIITIDKEGDFGYVQHLKPETINSGKIIIEKLNKNDVNLEKIQQLIDETPVDA